MRFICPPDKQKEHGVLHHALSNSDIIFYSIIPTLTPSSYISLATVPSPPPPSSLVQPKPSTQIIPSFLVPLAGLLEEDLLELELGLLELLELLLLLEELLLEDFLPSSIIGVSL